MEWVYWIGIEMSSIWVVVALSSFLWLIFLFSKYPIRWCYISKFTQSHFIHIIISYSFLWWYMEWYVDIDFLQLLIQLYILSIDIICTLFWFRTSKVPILQIEYVGLLFRYHCYQIHEIRKVIDVYLYSLMLICIRGKWSQ